MELGHNEAEPGTNDSLQRTEILAGSNPEKLLPAILKLNVVAEAYRSNPNGGPRSLVPPPARACQGGRYSLTSYGPTIINCSGAAAKPATRLHSRRGAPAEKEGTACMPSWHTYSRQGELGVWLVLVVNGREALGTHNFEVVLEVIERPADIALLQRGGALGWTLQEVERQHWADLLAAVPREHDESNRPLDDMRSQSGPFGEM